MDAIHRLLDDVERLAPPESWLAPWKLDDARAYIAKVRWTFARSMPKSPHWYTVRSKRPELTQDFLAFAQLIQGRGVLKIWGDCVRAYLEVDDWEYWTMGARVPETSIINRAPVGGPAAAQALPPQGDTHLLHGIERALAYRRTGAAADGRGGTLGQTVARGGRSAPSRSRPPAAAAPAPQQQPQPPTRGGAAAAAAAGVA